MTLNAPESMAPTHQVLLMLLRPIVRFALSKNIFIQQLIDALKAAVFEEVRDRVVSRGEKPTASRLSIGSGLTRKEVNRLMLGEGPVRDTPSVLVRVIGLWEQDKRYKNRDGTPRILSYGSDESEFAALCRAVTVHVGAKAILAELVRNGAAEITQKGAKLIRPTIDLCADEVGAFEIIAADTADLLSTLEHNRSHDVHDQNLHLRTQFDNVFVSSIPELKKWLISEGKAFHTQARARLAEEDKDVNPTNPTQSQAGARVVLTSFAYVELPTALPEKPLDDSSKVSQKPSVRRRGWSK